MQVTMSSIPPLPEHSKLLSELEPFYSQLAAEKISSRRHPVHHTNEVQVVFFGPSAVTSVLKTVSP